MVNRTGDESFQRQGLLGLPIYTIRDETAFPIFVSHLIQGGPAKWLVVTQEMCFHSPNIFKMYFIYRGNWKYWQATRVTGDQFPKHFCSVETPANVFL